MLFNSLAETVILFNAISLDIGVLILTENVTNCASIAHVNV